MTEILATAVDELLTPEVCIEQALAATPGAKACFTNSFQAEDMVVLHLLRRQIPDVSVLFLDTGYHFRETYEYRDRMTAEWNLNLVNVMPRNTVAQQESKLGLLYLVEPAQCCNLRKVEPLFRSLEPFDLWFTGLRREQSPTRRNLKQIDDHHDHRHLFSGASERKYHRAAVLACLVGGDTGVGQLLVNYRSPTRII